MDITSFVTNSRDQAFLIGDYNSYRIQLTRQLLALRKKLGRTTPKNAKYTTKAPVSASDIAGNHEFVKILLIQAERAWAQAMHMKSTHAEDNATKAISGSTRRHIISRLNKAAGHAKTLAGLLQDRTAAGATDIDYLEVQAYAQTLDGAEQFERQSSHRPEDPKAAWKQCLVSFSESHVIYTALLCSTQKDVYKDVLAGTVDPSIRYAAYQSRLSRTVPITTVAKQYFRRSQTELLFLIEKHNPAALEDEKTATTASKDGTASSAPYPTTVTWRNRTAPIVDATIGQALASTNLAASHLSAFLSSGRAASNNTKLAAAYDLVLTSAQDTVDAVRSAISDIAKEGIAESDSRTQDLRVSDLAVNHALISWRIGRNRVLISSPNTFDDGIIFTPSNPTSSKPKSKKRRTNVATHAKGESKPHQLARLADRIVLYSATLQSLDSIKDLRGASRDTEFMAELDGQSSYFQALRCLNIGYSHSVISAHKEALALFARASEIAETASSSSLQPASENSTPPSLSISNAQLERLRTHLATLLTRQRGLVSLHHFLAEDASKASSNSHTNLPPLSSRLHEYPTTPIDFTNLVNYPPKLEAIPVKPIFLDLAWNYIEYPGRETQSGDYRRTVADTTMSDAVEGVQETVSGVIEQGKQTAADVGEAVVEAPKKKGWFGFGRG